MAQTVRGCVRRSASLGGKKRGESEGGGAVGRVEDEQMKLESYLEVKLEGQVKDDTVATVRRGLPGSCALSSSVTLRNQAEF